MRKAQGGLNAAYLVAVLLGLIIIYILFLPDAEREALLENKTLDRVDSNNDDVDDILLREFPNRLDEFDEVKEKILPNVFLFETTNAEELERINPFIVRSGVFDKQEKSVSFSFDDPGSIENLILSFQTTKHEGALSIRYNGELIFEQDIDSTNVAPISLAKSNVPADNTLSFSVSGVGGAFWKTNEYALENIRVIGDVTDKSKQSSRNIFTLTQDDIFNIDETELRFVPYCGAVNDVGLLEVTVNGKNIFSAIPVCEDPYIQPIPSDILRQGENRIIFKTNKGSYSVEQISLEFDERETESNVYFFEVNQTELDRIEDGEDDAILTIEFVDDDDLKRADININNRFTSIDDTDRVFSKNLNDFLIDGNNFVEIIPRSRLDIVEIRVELEDR